MSDSKINERLKVVASYDVLDGGWISNVGHDEIGHPDTLSYDIKIEVEYRDGDIDTGLAGDWEVCWKETDNSDIDIVAYRIIK